VHQPSLRFGKRIAVTIDIEESQFDDGMRGPPELAAGMMKPYSGAIEAWEIGADVGNVKNNKPELMERVGLL